MVTPSYGLFLLLLHLHQRELPLSHAYSTSTSALLTADFYVFAPLLAALSQAFILFNVFVAILLDKMIEGPPDDAQVLDELETPPEALKDLAQSLKRRSDARDMANRFSIRHRPRLPSRHSDISTVGGCSRVLESQKAIDLETVLENQAKMMVSVQELAASQRILAANVTHLLGSMAPNGEKRSQTEGESSELSPGSSSKKVIRVRRRKRRAEIATSEVSEAAPQEASPSPSSSSLRI